MHLIDHARAYIEATYKRPLADRMLRQVLAFVLPNPRIFRLALAGAAMARPFRSWFARLPGGNRIAAMLELAPATFAAPSRMRAPLAVPAQGAQKARVAMLSGCAQPVLNPGINEAAIRLLTRHGVELVLPRGEGCCGALVHHMGREDAALASARKNVDAWTAEIEGKGLDAILITTSGCGTTVKDYGFMLRNDPAYAEKAARVSKLVKDVSEFLVTLPMQARVTVTGQTVAYHSACSMQHGQKIKDEPKRLLKAAGFVVKDVPEGHICCGSAGTYNIMQPEIAAQLRTRKLANIARTNAGIIATGNIGCMTQLGLGAGTPIVHTVELLDWATGGPRPAALHALP